MDNREKAIKMIESGASASEVAEELGISRQRVYQICASSGVSPKHKWVRNKPARPPRPRLLTGGVTIPVSQSAVGCISELLAAADLMARGWSVFMPVISSKGHDLIACKDDRIITVEVRSAYRNAAGQLKYNRKADCKSMFYALVVTGEAVSYEPQLE